MTLSQRLRTIPIAIILLLAQTITLVFANNTSPSQPQHATIQTSIGTISIELYPQQAPITVNNFLRYIESGAFENGRFYRVVRLDNDNGKPKIEVIQGGANPGFKNFSEIPLETTLQTGITHLDGTLSMARGAPGSATSEFFICVGPQPSLDFAGKRNPDGQGFAAFGRVIAGMEVVRKIHQMRNAKAVADQYVKGQMLAEPVTILSITAKPAKL